MTAISRDESLAADSIAWGYIKNDASGTVESLVKDSQSVYMSFAQWSAVNVKHRTVRAQFKKIGEQGKAFDKALMLSLRVSERGRRLADDGKFMSQKINSAELSDRRFLLNDMISQAQRGSTLAEQVTNAFRDIRRNLLQIYASLPDVMRCVDADLATIVTHLGSLNDQEEYLPGRAKILRRLSRAFSSETKRKALAIQQSLYRDKSELQSLSKLQDLVEPAFVGSTLLDWWEEIVRKLGTLRDSIPEDSNETLDAPLLERMLLEWTSISRQYAWYSAQIKFLSQTYAARSGKRPLNISLAPILKGVTSNPMQTVQRRADISEPDINISVDSSTSPSLAFPSVKNCLDSNDPNQSPVGSTVTEIDAMKPEDFNATGTPADLVKLASEINETIRLLMNACYNTQDGVYEASKKRTPPKFIREALEAHRSRLRRLWGESASPPTILWCLRRVENLGCDVEFLGKQFAKGKTLAQLSPLMQDYASRINQSISFSKDLAGKMEEASRAWGDVVRDVHRYLAGKEGGKSSSSTSPPLRQRIVVHISTAPSRAFDPLTVVAPSLAKPDVFISVKEAAAQHIALSRHLRVFEQFWVNQELFLGQVIRDGEILAAVEINNFARMWQDAREECRQAIREIGLAIDAYIKPR